MNNASRILLFLSIFIGGQVLANEVTSYVTQLSQVVESTENISKKTPILVAVSLGWNCEVGIQLRNAGIRSEAYPFDWLSMPSTAGLSKIFRENFAHFLDARYLKPEGGSVRNTHYDILFVHDFPTKENPHLTGSEEFPSTGGTSLPDYYLSALSNVQKKYERRIARLNQLMKAGVHVVFFRTNAWPEEAKELAEAIKARYPNSNFDIVVMHRYEKCKGEWNIPNVKSFHTNSFHSQYGYVGWFSDADWHRVLRAVGLIK